MFAKATLSLFTACCAAGALAVAPPTGTALAFNDIASFDSGSGLLQGCVALQDGQGQPQRDANGKTEIFNVVLQLQAPDLVFRLQSYVPFDQSAGKDCSGTFRNGSYSDKVLIKYPGYALDGAVVNLTMDYIGGSPNLLFRMRTDSASFGTVRNFSGNSVQLGTALGDFQTTSVRDFTNALPPSIKLKLPQCTDPQGDSDKLVLELDGKVLASATPGADYTLDTSLLQAGDHQLKAYCSDEDAIHNTATAAGLTAYAAYVATSAYAPGIVRLKVPTTATGSTGSTAQLNFQFDASTSASDQQLIRQAATFARDFFTTTFNRTLQKSATLITSATAQGCNNGGSSAFTGPQTLTICIANRGWTDHDSVNRQKIVVHEMFHLLQFELHWLGSTTPTGPQWLIEGAAEYVGWLGIAGMTTLSPPLPLATARGCMNKQVEDFIARQPPGLPNLDQLETAQQFSVPGPTYSLGMLGADQLVNGASANALLNYGTALASGTAVAAAFQSAFGTAQTAFYNQFPNYRANLSLPSTYQCGQ